jgi:hypothetical protein
MFFFSEGCVKKWIEKIFYHNEHLRLTLVGRGRQAVGRRTDDEIRSDRNLCLPAIITTFHSLSFIHESDANTPYSTRKHTPED